MTKSKIIVTKDKIIEGDKIHNIDEKRKPMNEKDANKALREASDLLDKMEIRNFLAFGTLLGRHRDGKILP